MAKQNFAALNGGGFCSRPIGENYVSSIEKYDVI